jgi:hypothetical protein
LIERPACLIRRPEFAKPVNRLRIFDDLHGPQPNHSSSKQKMAALSDVLKTVRLTGAAYFDIAAQEP